MEKKIAMFILVLLVLSTGISLVAAETTTPSVDPVTAFFNNLFHGVSSPFSVVGDSRVCGSSGGNANYAWSVASGSNLATGTVISGVRPSLNSWDIADVFTNGWTPYLEMKSSDLTGYSCGTGPCNIEVYVCPNPEPTSCPSGQTLTTATCTAWGAGYKCTANGVTESQIPYKYSSFKFCKTSTTKTCYYRSGTSCLTRSYDSANFPNSCSSYTYEGAPLYNDLSSCQNGLGNSCTINRECPSGKFCQSGTCQTSCTPNWISGSWSACTSGTQTRDVYDSNYCGVTTGKPTTSQTCTVTCVPDNSCAANTCTGTQCTNNCETVIAGTKTCTTTLLPGFQVPTTHALKATRTSTLTNAGDIDQYNAEANQYIYIESSKYTGTILPSTNFRILGTDVTLPYTTTIKTYELSTPTDHSTRVYRFNFTSHTYEYAGLASLDNNPQYYCTDMTLNFYIYTNTENRGCLASAPTNESLNDGAACLAQGGNQFLNCAAENTAIVTYAQLFKLDNSQMYCCKPTFINPDGSETITLTSFFSMSNEKFGKSKVLCQQTSDCALVSGYNVTCIESDLFLARQTEVFREQCDETGGWLDDIVDWTLKIGTLNLVKSDLCSNVAAGQTWFKTLFETHSTTPKYCIAKPQSTFTSVWESYLVFLSGLAIPYAWVMLTGVGLIIVVVVLVLGRIGK